MMRFSTPAIASLPTPLPQLLLVCLCARFAILIIVLPSLALFSFPSSLCCCSSCLSLLCLIYADFADAICSVMLSSCSSFFRLNGTLQRFYAATLQTKLPGQSSSPLSTSAFIADGIVHSSSSSSSSSSLSLTVSSSSVNIPARGTVSASLTLFRSSLASCYPDVRQAIAWNLNSSDAIRVTNLQILRLDVKNNGVTLSSLGVPVSFLVPIRLAFHFAGCSAVSPFSLLSPSTFSNSGLNRFLFSFDFVLVFVFVAPLRVIVRL